MDTDKFTYQQIPQNDEAFVKPVSDVEAVLNDEKFFPHTIGTAQWYKQKFPLFDEEVYVALEKAHLGDNVFKGLGEVAEKIIESTHTFADENKLNNAITIGTALSSPNEEGEVLIYPTEEDEIISYPYRGMNSRGANCHTPNCCDGKNCDDVDEHLRSPTALPLVKCPYCLGQEPLTLEQKMSICDRCVIRLCKANISMGNEASIESSANLICETVVSNDFGKANLICETVVSNNYGNANLCSENFFYGGANLLNDNWAHINSYGNNDPRITFLKNYHGCSWGQTGWIPCELSGKELDAYIETEYQKCIKEINDKILKLS